MKLTEKIFWIITFNKEPGKGGGGVARAAKTFLTKSKSLGFEIQEVHFFGFGFLSSLFRCVKILNESSARFVLHTLFSWPSIILLCFAKNQKIFLFTHGELQSEALNVSRLKKNIYFWFFSVFRRLRLHSAFTHCYVTSIEEELRLRRILVFNFHIHVIPDFFDLTALPSLRYSRDKTDAEVNIFTIARMTANKRVASIFKIANKCLSLPENININIHIFYAPESTEELQKCKIAAKNPAFLGKFNVVFYESLETDEIFWRLQNMTNRIAIFTSKFESFSYALLESLRIEFPPIVCFQNQLTKSLYNEDLIKIVNFNQPSLCFDLNLEDNHFERAEAFIHDYYDQVLTNYKKYFFEELYE